MRSVAVHVVCRKASIIVGKASFSQSCAYTSYYKIHLLCFAFSAYFFIASETSIPPSFVTFVKSNAKALSTLRIKSPLRSAESTTRNLLVNPVLVFAQTFTNTAYCARPNTLFMWTISSLARIFPYATSIEFLVATASATSFLSSAVMYLWGQLLRTRMVICMCRANTPSIGRQ